MLLNKGVDRTLINPTPPQSSLLLQVKLFGTTTTPSFVELCSIIQRP